MKGDRSADPDEYVAHLAGWQRDLVVALRDTVREAASFEEVLKWGHLVYMAEGPALMIRAEDERVLFGFWRGRRLRRIEPRLRPGGKYEMATLELRDGDAIEVSKVSELARSAAELNAELGDPRADARR